MPERVDRGVAVSERPLPEQAPAVLCLAPGSVTRVLAAIILFLALAHGVGLIFEFGLGHGTVLGLLELTRMSSEANPPAWYSASALLLTAGLLWVNAGIAARRGDPMARRWGVLAIAFAYVSMDEGGHIHEVVGRVTGIPWFYLWGAMAGVLGLYVLPLLARLPADTRRLFLTAALIFLCGAVGMERLNTWPPGSLADGICTMIEETLEMSGVLVFIHALLTHLSRDPGEVRIRVGARPTL
ncbi:MAG: hypothetical protein GX774_14345 [Armatimonadetes bacterium]|nr:hypothetical protein [Armatimonadota bacterium]